MKYDDNKYYARSRMTPMTQENIDIQARKLYSEVFLRFLGRGERSRKMETGVLHRISLRVS